MKARDYSHPSSQHSRTRSPHSPWHRSCHKAVVPIQRDSEAPHPSPVLTGSRDSALWYVKQSWLLGAIWQIILCSPLCTGIENHKRIDLGNMELPGTNAPETWRRATYGSSSTAGVSANVSASHLTIFYVSITHGSRIYIYTYIYKLSLQGKRQNISHKPACKSQGPHCGSSGWNRHQPIGTCRNPWVHWTSVCQPEPGSAPHHPTKSIWLPERFGARSRSSFSMGENQSTGKLNPKVWISMIRCPLLVDTEQWTKPLQANAKATKHVLQTCVHLKGLSVSPTYV